MPHQQKSPPDNASVSILPPRVPRVYRLLRTLFFLFPLRP
jgi:hypothetical protein